MVFNEKRKEKKKDRASWRVKIMQETQDNELNGGSPDGREMDRVGLRVRF